MTSRSTSSELRFGDGRSLTISSVGSGPGMVLVHGAMQSGESQRDLAELLAPGLTVHLYDRRGRTASGLSPAEQASTLRPVTGLEVADLRAVLEATGADTVMGISSGGIIAARAALVEKRLRRLVLFEPPLALDGSMRLDRAAAVSEAAERGDLAAAMGWAMKIAEMGPRWMFGLPLPVLRAASHRMLRHGAVRERAAALPADMAVVSENADSVEDFRAVTAQTLVLAGTSTRPYFVHAADALAQAIPGARRVGLPGLTHSATQNRAEYGRPERVAPEILRFLGDAHT